MIWRLAEHLPHPHKPLRIAASGDGAWFASSCPDQRIRLFDARTLALAKSWRTGVFCHALAFSPRGRQLVGGVKALGVFDLLTKERTRSIKGHRHTLHGAAFSPDGGALATVSGDNYTPADWSLRVWDPESGDERSRYKAPEPLHALAFSWRGDWIATGDHRGHVSLHDRAGGEPIWSRASGRWVYCVGFTRDDRFVLSGGDDDEIKVWDTTGALTRAIRTGGVTRSFAVSPDGGALLVGVNRAVGGLGPARIRLFDLASGEPIEDHPLRRGDEAIVGVCWAPDGRRFYAAQRGRQNGVVVYER